MQHFVFLGKMCTLIYRFIKISVKMFKTSALTSQTYAYEKCTLREKKRKLDFSNNLARNLKIGGILLREYNYCNFSFPRTLKYIPFCFFIHVFLTKLFCIPSQIAHIYVYTSKYI